MSHGPLATWCALRHGQLAGLRRRDIEPPAGHTKPGRHNLFRTDVGRHLHAPVIYKYWNTARKAARRLELRFHDLRHKGATLAAQKRARPQRSYRPDSATRPLEARRG